MAGISPSIDHLSISNPAARPGGSLSCACRLSPLYDRAGVVYLGQPRGPSGEYIEIRQRNEGRLITLLDVVSPVNRTSTEGKQAYLDKRREGKVGGASLVEIDLIVQGQPMLDYSRENMPEWDFAVTVTRAAQPERYEVYTATIQKRLPRFRMPLAGDDRDTVVDLQVAFSRSYDQAVSLKIDYQREPAAPIRRGPAVAGRTAETPQAAEVTCLRLAARRRRAGLDSALVGDERLNGCMGMSDLRMPVPVLLVVAAFSRHVPALVWAQERLSECFGPIAWTSLLFDFTQTRYYEAAMGPGLRKHFLVFLNLVDLGELANIKRRTNEIEQELARAGNYPESRPLNLDPGLLSLGKFQLATTKDQAQRVYLGGGVFAETTLRFHAGVFETWPWTYADYQLDFVRGVLGEAREYYRRRLRDEGAG